MPQCNGIQKLKINPTQECFIECLEEMQNAVAIDCGGPDPFRIPGRGKKGELSFRNSLIALRTVPLYNEESFIITHSEAGVYREGIAGKVSADLLGLWHKDSTRLCVAELKAGEKGDNIIYALAEGLRNLLLHASPVGMRRLREGWKNSKKDKVILNAWGKGNPFMGGKGRLKKLCLLVIGDEAWILQQSVHRGSAEKVISIIKKRFLNLDVQVYSFNKKAKPDSKPYMLLPLRKWLCV